MKKFLTLFVFVFLTACALSQPKLKSSNPTEVAFRFKDENGYNVKTYWRKKGFNEDDSSIFHAGMGTFKAIFNMPPSKFRPDVKKLDAGTYYMVKYEVFSNGGYVINRNANKLIWFVDGWDSEKNMPYLLSFNVKEGEGVKELPEVEFFVGKDIDTKKYFVELKFDDPNKIFTVGPYIKLKK